MKANLRIFLFSVASLGLVVLAFAELGLAAPVAGWLYLAVAGTFAIALLPLGPSRWTLARVSALVPIAAMIATLYFVPWTSRKPFLHDLARVRVGMSEGEVRQIMQGYLEGTGWPASPFDSATNSSRLSILGSSSQYATTTSATGGLVIRDSLVYRHSTNASFNSDWGIVSLSSGKVVRVEFSPD